MFGFLFSELVLARKDIIEDPEPDFLIQQCIRTISDPLFPSKKDLAEAAVAVMSVIRPNQRVRQSHRAGGQRSALAHGPRSSTPAPKTGSGATRRRRRRRGRGQGRRRGTGKGTAGAAPSV
jgi:hypothetical protein